MREYRILEGYIDEHGYHRKQVEFTCDQCGEKSIKEIKDFTKSLKRHSNMFCSRVCVARFNAEKRNNQYKKILEKCVFPDSLKNAGPEEIASFIIDNGITLNQFYKASGIGPKRLLKTRRIIAEKKKKENKEWLIEGNTTGNFNIIAVGEETVLAKCLYCKNEKVLPKQQLIHLIKNGFSCGCRNHKPHKSSALRSLLRRYKNRANTRKLAFLLTLEDLGEIIARPCHYCLLPPSMTKWNDGKTDSIAYNGLDRIDGDKGYTLDNVVSCCRNCNMSKGVMSAKEYIKWLKGVVERNKDRWNG